MKFLKALFLLENDFEDLEFFYPYYRLKEESIEVSVASSDRETKIGKHGYMITPDLTYSEVIPEEFAALIIPGGKSPERVRVNEKAVELVKKFSGKIIAAICHGSQLLISAGLVKGLRLTCWIGIRDDVIAAGGIYEDKEVVIDGKIITSRMPDDLPAFCRELLKKLKG